MALSRPGVVDLVTLSRDGSSAELVVLDEGEIADATERFEALQRKLVSYARYVADDQYLERAPGIPRDRVVIRVVCQTPPTDEMRSLVAFRASDFGVAVADLPVTVEADEEFRDRVQRETERWREQHPGPRRPWWKLRILTLLSLAVLARLAAATPSEARCATIATLGTEGCPEETT